MKPVGSLHNPVKIEIHRIGFGNGGMRTIVNHLTGTHGNTGFQIIDADTVASPGNIICHHTIFAECIYSRLPYFMFRQLGYKISIMAIISAAHSYVSLTPTVHHIERVRLNKTSISRRR